MTDIDVMERFLPFNGRYASLEGLHYTSGSNAR
jgi:hypothetical protein